MHFSAFAIVLSGVSLGHEHTKALITHVLTTLGSKNVASFTTKKDAGNVSSELAKGLVGQLSGIECFKFISVVFKSNQVELFVAWSHFLGKAVSYGVP